MFMVKAFFLSKMNVGKVLMQSFLASSVRPGLRRTVAVRSFATQAQVFEEKKEDVTKPKETANGPPAEFRQIFPEFLPNPQLEWRNKIREKLERMDMLKRRTQIEIPEFYVGTILAVVVSDPHAPGKTSKFLGICTERGETGLKAYFVLRNVIDHQGVEIRYDLYNPTIRKIEVIRLEKRLDHSLRYLRDCPLEYSTFPQDMEPEYLPDGAPVPVNDIKVPLKPQSWSAKWHLWNLQGVTPETYQDELKLWQKRRLATAMRISRDVAVSPFARFDLMRNYRKTIQQEEQDEIYKEVHATVGEVSRAKTRPKRVYVKPKKTV